MGITELQGWEEGEKWSRRCKETTHKRREGTRIRAWLRRARWKVFETAKAVSREITLPTLLLDACFKGSAKQRRQKAAACQGICGSSHHRGLGSHLQPRGSSHQFPVSHTLSRSEGTLILSVPLHLHPRAAAHRLPGTFTSASHNRGARGRSPTTI